MNRAELEQALRERCGAIAEPVIAALEPCVTLAVEPAADAEIPVGASKFGGAPDLPRGLRWPTWVRRDAQPSGLLRRKPETPLPFVAQLDLAAVAEVDAGTGLPADGLLLFFADVLGGVGLYPEDRDGFRLLWVEPGTPLERRGMEGFPSGRFTPRRDVSIPYIGAPRLDLAGIDVLDEEADALDELWEAANAEATHQLLGHGSFVQHSIEETAVQALHGCFSGPRFDHERWRQVEHEAADWRLLLQIDSDDRLGVMWGDVGQLQFAIRRDALARPRSEDAWFVLQSS